MYNISIYKHKYVYIKFGPTVDGLTNKQTTKLQRLIRKTVKSSHIWDLYHNPIDVDKVSLHTETPENCNYYRTWT